MRGPVLYTLARPVLRLVARAYFRRIEISGADHVPDGAVILAANHPQSLTDGVVLGLATRRNVHYVAHSGLFAHAVLRWMLRHSGVIPIHRPRDVADAAVRNAGSFLACQQVLERGGCLGIFPEGTSRDERRVQDFKTGTVRIAFDTESAHDFRIGVAIVPVGLSFQSTDRFRSRVLVTFGPPLYVAEHRAAYEAAADETVRRLTHELQERVRRSVVDIQSQELEEFVRDVEHVYKGELLDRAGLDIPGDSRYERGQTLSREIARATEYFYEERPELIASIRQTLREYRRRLDRVSMPDRIVREQGQSFRRRAIRLAILFAVGLPLATWGVICNYVPYRLTAEIVRRWRPDHTKIHSLQLTVGAVLFASFYAAYLWTLWEQNGRWNSSELMAFFVSWPLGGIFARRYLLALGRSRLHLRWAYLRATRKVLVQNLLTMRADIIAVMDAALADYMERMDSRDSEARD